MSTKAKWKKEADKLVRAGDPTITFYYEYRGVTYSYTPYRKKPKDIRPKIKKTLPPIFCDWCHNEFVPRDSRQHFCSDECRINNYNKNKIDETHSREFTRICKNCGKEFNTWQRKRVFCSEKCSDRYTSHKGKNESDWEKHLDEIGYDSDVKGFVTKDPQGYLDKYNAGVDYVSGWTETRGTAVVKCRDCGYEFEHGMDNVRHGKKIRCPRCHAEEINKAKEQKEKIKRENREAREKLIEKHKIESSLLRESKKRTVVCDICGNEFITYHSSRKRCSKECTEKYQKCYANRKKDLRLKNKRRDYGISAKALMEKENGICYICGLPCDENDYILDIDGNFIAGDLYPSVDHVLAIANGGTDTWDNVRLAHRKCNYMKSDNLIERSSGQMSLFYGT